MNICVDCKYYKVASDEIHDICLHEKSEFGGVREIKRHSCDSMRAGICRNGQLFVPMKGWLESPHQDKASA